MLAQYFDEPGAEQVNALMNDPSAVVGISVITLFEIATVVQHLSGSGQLGIEAMKVSKSATAEIAIVSESVIERAIDLRRTSLADSIIAATAELYGAILVHRDPHFTALPSGRPVQELLPDKSKSKP